LQSKGLKLKKNKSGFYILSLPAMLRAFDVAAKLASSARIRTPVLIFVLSREETKFSVESRLRLICDSLCKPVYVFFYQQNGCRNNLYPRTSRRL